MRSLILASTLVFAQVDPSKVDVKKVIAEAEKAKAKANNAPQENYVDVSERTRLILEKLQAQAELNTIRMADARAKLLQIAIDGEKAVLLECVKLGGKVVSDCKFDEGKMKIALVKNP